MDKIPNLLPTILRISVSRPKNVAWNGTTIATGIFKSPVQGKTMARRLNLDGDEQADLTVHGGPDKAIYAYPVEHYQYWEQELPDRELAWGMFGENLTLSGFNEDSLCIGDRLKCGTALFAVTQPRMPCYKLGIKFGDPGIIRRFYRSGKWGFYLSVLEEGEIETGDHLFFEGGDGNGVSLSDVTRCFLEPEPKPALLSKVMRSNLALQMKEELKYHFARKLLKNGS